MPTIMIEVDLQVPAIDHLRADFQRELFVREYFLFDNGDITEQAAWLAKC